MYLFVHVSAHSIDCIWRSEDNMQESVLYFLPIDPRVELNLGYGLRCHYQLN